MSKSIRYLSCIFAAALAALAAVSPGADLPGEPEAMLKEGKFTEARAAFEKALAVENITPGQTAEALLGLGRACIGAKKVQEGIAALDKARAMTNAPSPVLIQANLLYGETYLAYPWVLPQAKEAFERVLALPGITPDQTLAARRGIVKALMGMRQFAGARAVMAELAASAGLPPAEKAQTQMAIGTTLMLEGKFAEARTELVKALAMEGLTDDDKVHIQFQVALSYYDAGDFANARPELEKVLVMPRAGAHQARNNNWDPYFPAREAKLRLAKMSPPAGGEKNLNVLFIGSSMTIRGWMPFEVEAISASAPTGTPRITSANFVRGGTKIDVFWNDGDTRDTARSRIASFPWDYVVLETFYNMKPEDLLKYGQLFCDFARGKNIKPVFYESQPAKAHSYPDGFRKFHEDNLRLKEAANARLAPVVLAQLHYLGPDATPEQLGAFYDDWVHFSGRGKHLAACCIYAVLTGLSPVGLEHPKDIPDDEARKIQEAAWKAVREANPDLKP